MSEFREQLVNYAAKIDIIADKVQTTDAAVEKLNKKVDAIDETISNMKISIVETKVNNQWAKRLLVLVLTAVLAGGGVVGGSKLLSTDSSQTTVTAVDNTTK